MATLEGYKRQKPDKPQLFECQFNGARHGGEVIYFSDLLHAIGNSDQYPVELWSDTPEGRIQQATIDAVAEAIERCPRYRPQPCGSKERLMEERSMERRTIKTTITDTECELAAEMREEKSDFVAAYCLSVSDDETAIETTVHVCGRMGTQEVVGSLSHATVDIIIEAEPKPEDRASLYLAYLNTFKARMKEADPEAVALMKDELEEPEAPGEKEGGPDA